MNMVKVKEMVEKEIAIIRETADLPTIPLGMEEDMVKLAHDSRDILGYGVLHGKVVGGTTRLANVLIELGIEVLSPEAILKYQMKMGRPSPSLIRLVETGTGVLDQEDDDVADDDEDEEDDEDDSDDEEEPAKKEPSSGLGRLTNYVWYRSSIQDYSKPIPPHVLAKAIEIKKALPTTEFLVEELKYFPDPFLIASFMGEQFYVEVWDEPTFEKRATKNAKSQSRDRKSRG